MYDIYIANTYQHNMYIYSKYIQVNSIIYSLACLLRINILYRLEFKICLRLLFDICNTLSSFMHIFITKRKQVQYKILDAQIFFRIRMQSPSFYSVIRRKVKKKITTTIQNHIIYIKHQNLFLNSKSKDCKLVLL